MPFSTISPDAAEEEILRDLGQAGRDRQRGEELLFMHYSYFIEQAMHKYSLQEEDSFTIYTDTILAAIPKIKDGSFERRSSLKTWLYQIFHNKCVDLLRKNATNKSSVHRKRVVIDQYVQVEDTAKLVLQQMIDQHDLEEIKNRLVETGENCRKMLLHWAEGYSDKEIAALMEYKSADVVKTSRLRCLDKLRQLFNIRKR